jgi:hypothetical protein
MQAGRMVLRREENSFLIEQRGNVSENKGPPWKKWKLGGNVIENTGSYAFITGMLLKIKVVNGWKAGRRSQKWQAEGRKQNDATDLGCNAADVLSDMLINSFIFLGSRFT